MATWSIVSGQWGDHLKQEGVERVRAAHLRGGSEGRNSERWSGSKLSPLIHIASFLQLGLTSQSILHLPTAHSYATNPSKG